ncbi:MAG: OmpA family protein [Bacteroidetes bacterium]|nr:OmpA family protein [Bacteroidota bacterium]
MINRLFTGLIFGWNLIAGAAINVDSVYAAYYTKTLSDSVFEVGDVLRAPEIWFELSGHGFMPESDSSFKKLAEFYRRNPFILTEIQVHSDTRGQADANLRLSLYRAKAVVSQLITQYGDEFIFTERLLPVGKGETQPIVPDEIINRYLHDKYTCEVLHQVNRRIDIRIIGFIGRDFYKNNAASVRQVDWSKVRNSAYYEDLIVIADRALLEGDYRKALEFYSYAADVAPAHEMYAAEQRDKIKTLMSAD